MSFICTYEPGAPLATITLNSEAGQGETIVRIAIGHDDETGAIYSSFTCLATVPAFGEDRYELVFSVVRADGRAVEYFRDGALTRNIIANTVHRAYILNTICDATQKLIDDVQPQEVVMSTREGSLPFKALLKYRRIINVFQGNGYDIHQGEPYHGRDIWTFTKP